MTAKPLTEFYTRKDVTGYHRACKECFNKAGTITRRLRATGCTEELYRKLLAQQNNRCAICGIPAGRVLRSALAADHCHKTQTVRGLLCHHCNLGIGNFKDSVARLEKAIAYLKRVDEKI